MSSNRSRANLIYRGNVILSCVDRMVLQLRQSDVCLLYKLKGNDICRTVYAATFSGNFNALQNTDLSDPLARTTYVWFNFSMNVPASSFSELTQVCFNESFAINKTQGTAASGSFEDRIRQF